MVRGLLAVFLALWAGSASAQSTCSATVASPGCAGSASFGSITNVFQPSANVVEIRNGLSPQTLNIYATYTSDSDYERGFVRWDQATSQFQFGVEVAGTGTPRNFAINAKMANRVIALHAGSGTGEVLVHVDGANEMFGPGVTDAYDLGRIVNSAVYWRNLYLTRSVQGSKSKVVVDNTATTFATATVSDDDYEGCDLIWDAFAEDADTDARQHRHGREALSILNNSGTEACVFQNYQSAVQVTAGTLTVAFDCTAGTNLVNIRATVNTSLDAAAETLTFESRFDCPSTTTLTFP